MHEAAHGVGLGRETSAARSLRFRKPRSRSSIACCRRPGRRRSLGNHDVFHRIEGEQRRVANHLAEGGTVAVKVLSPDIVHKSDIGDTKIRDGQLHELHLGIIRVSPDLEAQG
jgi:hypothetical protein